MADAPRSEKRDTAPPAEQRARVATARDAGCDADTRARAAESAGALLDSLLSRLSR